MDILAEEQKYQLNATDRCDKCSAQAYVLVRGTQGELLFCGHHYNSIVDDPEGYKKIMSFMYEIIDERHKLSGSEMA